MPKNWDNIPIQKPTKARLKLIYESRKHELLDRGINSFNGFMQEVFIDYIESNEQLSKYAPYLSDSQIELDHVSVKDAKLNRVVDVYLRDSSLYCEFHKLTDCAHVAYVWSLPKIYKALKDRGMKPPK